MNTASAECGTKAYICLRATLYTVSVGLGGGELGEWQGKEVGEEGAGDPLEEDGAPDLECEKSNSRELRELKEMEERSVNCLSSIQSQAVFSHCLRKKEMAVSMK